MNRRPVQSNKTLVEACVCLLMIAFVVLGCGLKKPWRSYEAQPFDSQKWRDGDAITRGTMIVDLFQKRTVNGKTRELIVGLLGEPDKKKTTGDGEIWLYKVEVAGEKPIQYLPVSFDKNGMASAGMTKGGTRSILADDE